ncbi:hypothetical protein BpHYR1_019978, partial [Brachionus plicatilis]
KANSIPYHFADWCKFSFLEMVLKDQYSKNKNIFLDKLKLKNSKLKGVWWGIDKLLFFQKIGGVDFRHNLSKRIRFGDTKIQKSTITN